MSTETSCTRTSRHESSKLLVVKCTVIVVHIQSAAAAILGCASPTLLPNSFVLQLMSAVSDSYRHMPAAWTVVMNVQNIRKSGELVRLSTVRHQCLVLGCLVGLACHFAGDLDRFRSVQFTSLSCHSTTHPRHRQTASHQV